MNISRCFLVALLSFGANARSQTGDVTTDPVAHLKSFYDMTGVTKIYRLVADINNDGLNEVLLSPLEPETDNEADLGWLFYIGKPGGEYLLAGEKTDAGIRPNSLISFNKSLYLIGSIPEVGQHGLLTLVSGTGGQAECQLSAFLIEGDAFKEVPIGEPVSAEDNYDQLKQRFPQPPAPAAEELAP